MLVATAVGVAVAVALSGCGRGDQRAEVLADFAEEVGAPAYGELAVTTNDLTLAVSALCSEPSVASLNDAQDALVQARRAWSTTEAMWLGPAMERRAWAVIDWPVAATEIEELISDTTVVLDPQTLATRIGADQRGLGAVEYVLGVPGETETLDDLGDQRRCDYLVGVVTVASEAALALHNDWTASFQDSEPYVGLIADDEAGALDMLVNDSLFLLEAIGDAELGQALGLMSADGDADTDNIHEGPAGLGVADIAGHLNGLRAVMIGSDARGGLGPLLDDRLVDQLETQFDAADAAVAVLQPPLLSAIAEQRDDVLSLREAVQAIQTTVATEVVSGLGVTVGFSDADGDTGG